MFSGFQKIDMEVSGATIHARVGGDGPPVLLLHGYPQTHVMWHVVAEDLAKTHRVVVADLRGYGDSVAKADDFTFRAMAQDQVDLMRHLGHETFHVVSHDRGARTAHRMVLDHPDVVQSLVLMDILPTLDVWRTMDDWLAQKYYHWLFLAQPGDMPRRLINADPICYLHAALLGLAGSKEMFDPRALAEYERAARNPSVVGAWCADYTAAASADRVHDAQDEGRTSDILCLVLWGQRGVIARHIHPLDAWRAWFPNVTGHDIDAGHFLVEERPDEVLAAVSQHLAASG